MQTNNSRRQTPRHIIFRSLICLLILPLLLGACALDQKKTTALPDSRAWDYSQTKPAPAAEAPRSLYEYYAQQENMPGLPGQAPLNQSQASVNPSQSRTVKVGLLLPLSGKHAALGEAMMNAAQMAIFDIGYKNFELMPQDTGGTGAGAASAARQALQGGAELLIGPVFAEEVRAVKPIAAGAGIPVIGFSTDWTLAGGGTFVMGFLPFDQIERVAVFAQQRQPGRMGIIAPDTEYGRAIAGALKTLAQHKAWPAPHIALFAPGTNDLNGVVRSFVSGLANEPASSTQPPISTIMLPMEGATMANISALLSQYGLPPGRVQRLGTGLLDDASLAANPALAGALFAAPAPAARQNFERRYFENFSSAPPRLSTLAYDAAALSAVLAQRGLTKDGKPAYDTASIMNPNGFAGLDGIFRFRSGGIAERGLAVLSFNSGRITVQSEAPRSFQTPAPAF